MDAGAVNSGAVDGGEVDPGVVDPGVVDWSACANPFDELANTRTAQRKDAKYCLNNFIVNSPGRSG